MSNDLWFVHYTVVIPQPRTPQQMLGLSPSSPPKTQELIAGPYEGFEAVLERQKLLKQEHVVDAFLDRAPAPKTVAVSVHSYRGTGR